MRDHPNFRGRLGRRQLLTGVVGGLLGSLALPRRGARAAAWGRCAERPAVARDERRAPTSSRSRRPTALVLVDSGTPELQRSSDGRRCGQLSPGGRISTLFNTHFHPENTGANEMLRQAGATIVAHENTRLWMATPVWMPADDRYRPPRPKAAHPTETFRVDGSMSAGRRAHRLRLPDRSAHERRHLRLLPRLERAGRRRRRVAGARSGARLLHRRVARRPRRRAEPAARAEQRHDADRARLRSGDEPRGSAGSSATS